MSPRDEMGRSWGTLGGFLGALVGVYLGKYGALFLLGSNNFIFPIICIPEVVIPLVVGGSCGAVLGSLIVNSLPGGLPVVLNRNPIVLFCLTLAPLLLSWHLFQRITVPTSDQELLSLYPQEKPALDAIVPLIKKDPNVMYGTGWNPGSKPVPQAHVDELNRVLETARQFLYVKSYGVEGSFHCALWDYCGDSRGFAYLPKPPQPSAIYKDLNFNGFSYECTTAYKPIGGHWYLFYYSDPS